MSRIVTEREGWTAHPKWQGQQDVVAWGVFKGSWNQVGADLSGLPLWSMLRWGRGPGTHLGIGCARLTSKMG